MPGAWCGSAVPIEQSWRGTRDAIGDRYAFTGPIVPAPAGGLSQLQQQQSAAPQGEYHRPAARHDPRLY